MWPRAEEERVEYERWWPPCWAAIETALPALKACDKAQGVLVVPRWLHGCPLPCA